MLKFSLFGAGRIGRLHAANLAASAKASLTCVYDIDDTVARKVAEDHGARVAADVDDALSSDIDAVLIASSTDTHVDLITAAAHSGKAVFCEKPIDFDITRVERCREAIAECGVPVQIGFNRRYDPNHRALHDAVRAGEIGAVEMIVISSRDPAPPPADYIKVSGGLFRDMMIHDFDMARFVLGAEPTTVSAIASCLVDPHIGALGDVDTAMVTLSTETGVLCHINNSRRAVYGYDQRVEAFGSDGMLCSDNPRPTSLTHYGKTATASDPLMHFFLERYRQSYQLQLNDFIDAVEQGRDTSVSFEDGRRALLLANAAEQSLRTEKAVSLE